MCSENAAVLGRSSGDSARTGVIDSTPVSTLFPSSSVAAGVLPAATVTRPQATSLVARSACSWWEEARTTDSCRMGWWRRGEGHSAGHRSSLLRHDASGPGATENMSFRRVSGDVDPRCLDHDDTLPRESYDSARLRSGEGHRTEWCRQSVESIASTGSPVAGRMGAACAYWCDGRGHQSFGAGFAPLSLPSEPWQPH